MKAHIGIDVSKASLAVCYLQDPVHHRTVHQTFENNPAGHTQLLRWVTKTTQCAFEDCSVCLEATGVYHLNISSRLHTNRLKVHVVNPLQSHHYAKGLGLRAKTDGLDAAMLARLDTERDLPLWQPTAGELLELKALNTRLDMVEQDIRREQNRLESAAIAAHSKSVIRHIRQSLRYLYKQVDTLLEAMNALIEKHAHLQRNRALLLSITGVGEVTSRYLVAEIHADRFTSAAQCAAYFGLVPVPQQSGKQERVRLSKAGNRKVKAKLYMAAISAKRYNPVLKAQYDRLIQRGKSKMSALCAVMRKLVQICYGVIKHQKAFCLPV